MGGIFVKGDSKKGLRKLKTTTCIWFRDFTLPLIVHMKTHIQVVKFKIKNTDLLIIRSLGKYTISSIKLKQKYIYIYMGS